jgi:dynein heavy chain
MAKIRKLDKSVMESEEARDVIKDYTAFQGQLSDYEREQIEAWGAEMEKSSQAKLKNPLLRSEVDVEFGYPLLYVNFDPLLVRLLREVKYFLLLGFEAPQAALEIYEHAETFRKHMGNLDLVVNVYNWMQAEMLPVERPLLSKQLELLDDVLAQGIAPHKDLLEDAVTEETPKKKKKKSKKKPLNWKSNNIDLFVLPRPFVPARGSERSGRVDGVVPPRRHAPDSPVDVRAGTSTRA